jgi:hypothetical protein
MIFLNVIIQFYYVFKNRFCQHKSLLALKANHLLIHYVTLFDVSLLLQPVLVIYFMFSFIRRQTQQEALHLQENVQKLEIQNSALVSELEKVQASLGALQGSYSKEKQEWTAHVDEIKQT